MSPFYRATLAPRIMVVIGALCVAATVFGKVEGAPGAVLQIGGGLLSLAGVAWFLLAARRARRG